MQFASEARGRTILPSTAELLHGGIRAFFLGLAVVVGGVILIGSWMKLAQLSSGGKVVAQGLGGRPVEPTTTDLPERRLLNVVEEMAIASGVPVPEVWIMDEEQGINAFAAGTDPTNAVIGVTRGTLERLTRSELQGVVAHEFSHILNGDMKLNMRLMGWIFGLVMLSMLGRIMLESFRFMRGSRDSKGGRSRHRYYSCRSRRLAWSDPSVCFSPVCCSRRFPASASTSRMHPRCSSRAIRVGLPGR